MTEVTSDEIYLLLITRHFADHGVACASGGLDSSGPCRRLTENRTDALTTKNTITPTTIHRFTCVVFLCTLTNGWPALLSSKPMGNKYCPRGRWFRWEHRGMYRPGHQETTSRLSAKNPAQPVLPAGLARPSHTAGVNTHCKLPLRRGLMEPRFD